MVWGSWRLNIIWKLLRNDSGVILEILEIYSGSFFNVTVYLLNILGKNDLSEPLTFLEHFLKVWIENDILCQIGLSDLL